MSTSQLLSITWLSRFLIRNRELFSSSTSPSYILPLTILYEATTMSTYRSNVIVILVLAVAFVVLQQSKAQSDIYGQKTDTKHKYCGKHLSSALQLLCNGVYNSMFKKNGQEMEMDDYPYAYDYPMTSRANANAMMGRFGGMRLRRQSPSRGVHDECCVNACTIDELASYCAH